MALPILDGNQTATTLSTVVSAGAHIPAHTVVSLGAQAITDMRSAVSGSVVSISNFPPTQTIAGTVTANVAWQAGEFYPFRGDQDGAPDLGAGIVFQKNDYGAAIVGDNNPLPISGTVTASVANSITVGALPVQLSTTTIGGTARLNVTLSSATTVGATAPSYANLYGGSDGTNLRAISVDSSGRTVVTGTVGVSGTVPVSGTFYQATQPVSLASLPSLAAGSAQIGSVTASIFGTPTVTMGAISGTVTVSSTTVTVSALPNGALTTRFGSVTTANTSILTSCVTNSSRKYLLAQNISAGTVTIGIGFSPTTTQGIQLSAGGGISFDSFCPTGAVWWLGATTGANFTILEG